MTAIILQVRLDSSRLPRKALLDLGGKPVILRVMENLRRIGVDEWILACDTDSEETLAPLAVSAGFRCVSGPKDDVLERFCIVIKRFGIDTVLRATGDNPYLFADAAEESLRRFSTLQQTPSGVDYFTFNGLPHGSGIEVFSGRSLLAAAALTDSPYDHEHVGPALYNHAHRFVCIRETAPSRWYFPDVTTTIDTREDYERACSIAHYLGERNIALPSSTVEILAAWNYISFPVLFIPSTVAGQGTGHLRRLSSIAIALSASRRCLVFIPPENRPFIDIPELFLPFVVSTLPASAVLVVVDGFRTTVSKMAQYRSIGPVVALDEGGPGRLQADYLLDIIPGMFRARNAPNRREPSFLPLPVQRKKNPVTSIKTVLVLAGGENAAGLALPVARSLSGMHFDVTVIDPDVTGLRRTDEGFTVSGPVHNLRETLCNYDLVMTHYGFTAFESLAAGCRVILFSPTQYHFSLAKAVGFSALPSGPVNSASIKKIIHEGIKIPKIVDSKTIQKDLPAEIERLASRLSVSCPVCGNAGNHRCIARYPDRTIARCPVCGINYILFQVAEPKVYSRSYFFDEYQAQYGKTYLEDFQSIKAQGFLRLERIASVGKTLLRGRPSGEKSLLDIGCAFGPFLSAAKDLGWSPFGTDISEEAVRYVLDTLALPAVQSAFPVPDADGFISGRQYDAVTLWYVIEHFMDLEPVLLRIGKLLVPGGILAFSTPSASGVTGRFKAEKFYRESPLDHFTIWDPRTVRRQLEHYGFKVVKIVATGHHPERFPFMNGRKGGRVTASVLRAISRVFSLGDTFEVYAIKNGTLEDVK